MSKLAEQIRRISRMEAPPIGFAAAARQQNMQTLLCLVALSANDVGKAAEAIEKGADAVIIEGADPGKLAQQVKKAGRGVFGVSLARAGRDRVVSLRQAGADFIVIDEETSAEALLEEGVGFVLNARDEADDTRLRVLGDLGFDAVIVPPPDRGLNVDGMMRLRRVAALTRAPLLTRVPAESEGPLLEVLRASGVAGVILDGSQVGKLGTLKERILSLPPRRRRRDEPGEPLLPALARSSGDYEDEDWAPDTITLT
jgi:hypothetical protein